VLGRLYSCAYSVAKDMVVLLGQDFLLVLLLILLLLFLEAVKNNQMKQVVAKPRESAICMLLLTCYYS